MVLRMQPLAEPAIAAVERGDILMVPENRRTEYLNWMRNIRDWTMSRQLWWGHRIPAWYCGNAATLPWHGRRQDVPEVRVDETASRIRTSWTLGSARDFGRFRRSAGRKRRRTSRRYYPTSLLITRYDILFFWVARMIMWGFISRGKVPFRAVYLHSLVRTASGEKMSKSKGTGLDPVALNQQYGTDAMRFCLASMAAPGTDIILSDDRLAGSRRFANKIWNAARFLFVNLEKFEQGGTRLDELAAPEVRERAPYAFKGEVPLIDRWLFGRLAETVETVNAALEDYRFHEAAQGVYQFFWGDFCDWYIEWVKPELQSADRERATVAWKNLFAGFDAALRMLHPFMPFLTEELWHQLPQKAGLKSIALDSYPTAEWAALRDEIALRQFGLVQEVIRSLRTIRSGMKLDNKKVAAEFSSADAGARAVVEANREGITRLASLTELRVTEQKLPEGGGGVRSTEAFDIRIPYAAETVDAAGEVARLKKESEGLEKAIASKEKQLGNETFRSRAPENIIKQMEETLAGQKVELGKVQERLRSLEGT